MAGERIVESGDCIGSIAYESGFFWETIWNDPQNKALKEKRKNPNVLLPGDVVYVPDLRPREESVATEQLHRFRLKGVPAKFHIRLLLDGKPRANVDYQLEIEGNTVTGKTTGNGEITRSIAPNAREGRLRVKNKQGWDEYILRLGGLDPAENVTGAQARLRNLGFDLGDEHGELGPLTTSALRQFQRWSGLEVTGRLDEATIGQLNEQHDTGEVPENKERKPPPGGREWEAPDLTRVVQSEDMLDEIEEFEPATSPDWDDQPDDDEQVA
jgi:N-acetylmuramoyl-L-alanine amidase